MIYQTDRRLSKYLNKYGCLFTALAYARPYLGGREWGAIALQGAWDEAVAKGILSGDLNKDGDLDDPGEIEIIDYSSLLRLLKVPLLWIPGHHNPDTSIEKGIYVIGAFFNPRTKFTHFAVVDSKKKVIFDPIEGGSITCKEGYLKSLRLFSIEV